jgi:hypothetical protein
MLSAGFMTWDGEARGVEIPATEAKRMLRRVNAALQRETKPTPAPVPKRVRIFSLGPEHLPADPVGESVQ